jgi:DNA-binding YbaB/EbfC family protein
MYSGDGWWKSRTCKSNGFVITKYAATTKLKHNAADGLFTRPSYFEIIKIGSKDKGGRQEDGFTHFPFSPLLYFTDTHTDTGTFLSKERVMTKGFGNLIRQAQQLQSKMMQVQEEMAGRTVEASAGGGMVVAVANGKQQLVSIKIEKEVVNPEDVEMLQDLVAAAVNAALKNAQEMMAEEMKKLTGGMNIPGMM